MEISAQVLVLELLQNHNGDREEEEEKALLSWKFLSVERRTGGRR